MKLPDQPPLKLDNDCRPIAVFDSGVGGLTLLPHLFKQLPQENYIYLADQANVPYGEHPLETINHFCDQITRFLLSQTIKMVVVACNTATAAALSQLRQNFPQIPFVGMEPAVKPAALGTKTKVVGVLATQGTFASERYASLMARYAADIKVIEDPCRGLVELIESGLLGGPPVLEFLQPIISPMVEAGMDTLVLGCTHYPLILRPLHDLIGDGVTIIDPAPAVAVQAKRVLRHQCRLTSNESPGQVQYMTSGSPEGLQQLLSSAFAITAPIEKITWHNGKLRRHG